MLLHRPDVGILHKIPDALCRHPPDRDMLILARQSEWHQWRAVIRGVKEAIDRGEFDDEEPELYVIP